MADPLSILGATAAASQLASQAFGLVKILSSLYGKIQDAPELTRTRISQLEQLIDISKLITKTPPLQTIEVQKALVACLETTLKLQKLLKEHSPDEVRKLKRIVNAVKAVYKEDEIVTLLERIDREKGLIALCIHQIDSTQLHSISITVAELESGMGNMSLVLDDTARNVQTVIGIVPKMAGQVQSIFEELPKLASGLSTIHEQLRATNISPAPATEIRQYYEVPNRRVRDFIGRESILAQIDAGFKSQTEKAPRTVVIRALGGQGKTQIALEFCRRMKHSGPSAIFWIDASSESTVKQSFSSISECLGTRRDEFPDVDTRARFILRKFADWPDPWVMVFDNYDNPAEFNNIDDYMPENEQGMILITSRHADAGRLADEENQIELPGMPESEAVELLFSESQLKSTEEGFKHGKEIVTRLGYHALAIAQAGAYINKRKLPLAEFLAHFERRKAVIMKETHPQMSKYRRKLTGVEREVSLSVFTTWELSYHQLLAGNIEGKDIADILTLFAFFDSTDISESLFQAYCDSSDVNTTITPGSSQTEVDGSNIDRPEQPDGAHMDHHPGSFLDLHKGRWDSDCYSDAVASMSQLSLVQAFTKRADGFYHASLHPLVRDWVRLRTDECTCRKYTYLAAMCIYRLLNSAQGRSHFELALPIRLELLKHLDVYKANLKDFFTEEPDIMYGNDNAHYGELNLDFAGFWNKEGEQSKAEESYRWCLAQQLKDLGHNDPVTLRTSTALASVLETQGKYKEAREIVQQSLTLSKEVLGEEHRETLQSMAVLGQILISQGKFKEAENVIRETLRLREKVLGKEDSATVVTMDTLARIIRRQGKYVESEALSRETLELQEKLVGRDHPETLVFKHNLARSLSGLGKVVEAEILFRDILNGEERLLGKKHPNIMVTMGNLAVVLAKQKRWKEAEELMRKVNLIYEKVLGKEHPETLSAMNNLAQCLSHQEKRKESEELNRQLISIRERVLGKEHPNTLVTISNLAVDLASQEKWKEAEVLGRRVLSIQEKVIGKEHPGVLTTMSNLAGYLFSQGKWKESEELNRQVLSISEKVLGEEHPDTLITMDDLAANLSNKGMWKESEELLRQVLSIREKVLEEDHQDILKSLTKLGNLLWRTRQYQEASRLYERAIAVSVKSHGSDDPKTLGLQEDLEALLEEMVEERQNVEIQEDNSARIESTP